MPIDIRQEIEMHALSDQALHDLRVGAAELDLFRGGDDDGVQLGSGCCY